MQNKDEVVKNLERRLLNAKVIAETNPCHKTHPHHNSKTSRWQTFASAPTAWPPYTNDTNRFSRCSMACAFRLAGCPWSTLRGFMAIAELIKVDSRELDLVLRDQRVTSVRDLKVVCRKRLQRYIPVMSNMRREGQMLPMKFEARLYD